jgi:two-component system, LytTR family, sensor kinase
MTKSEKYLPYIISIVLPCINQLSNNPFEKNIQLADFVLNWVLSAVILFCIWQLIEWILTKFNKSSWKSVIAILGSIGFICTFIALQDLFFPTLLFKAPNWLLFLKLFMGSLLSMTIIHSFRAVKEKEQFKIENISLQAENTKAQYNLLIQQVNPHFLFNCLSSLRTMVRVNDPKSEEYVLKLSDVYRQILQNEAPIVTLKEELAFLDAYIYLMKLRHDDALFFDVTVSDESLDDHLPIFSLQLLLENCIKHNIVSANKPLTIRLFQKDKSSITVSNNFQPKKMGVESTRLGIKNLEQRYALSGIKDGVLIEHNAEYYQTTLKLFQK